MKEYLSLLSKRKNFRYLWLASVVSFMGDWFNTIASVMIVNRYTDSGLAISWVLIARTLPRFFVGPLAGVVADRINRKAVMVVSDLLRAGIVLSFLFVDRPERVWLIYVLTTAQFVIASFFEPASSAILPSLVQDSDEMLTANVLQSATWSTMLAVGSAIGGGIAGYFGASIALILDAVTFLISAVLVLQIKTPADLGEKGETQSGWLDFIDGFRYVLTRPAVVVMVLVKTLGQIGSSDIIVVMYAKHFFPIGEEGAGAMGIMYAAMGVGAVLGPLVSKRLTDGSPKALRGVILAGYIMIPLGWFFSGIGVQVGLWVVSLAFLLRLAGTSINWTFSNVLIQLQVPDHFLGRVFALDLALFTVASSASVWLTGYLLDNTSIEPQRLVLYFAAGGVLPVVFWAFSLLSSRRAEQAMV